MDYYATINLCLCLISIDLVLSVTKQYVYSGMPELGGLGGGPQYLADNLTLFQQILLTLY